MSKRVKGITQIKNASLLKRVLEDQHIDYIEKDDTISWGEGFGFMKIDLTTGEMTYDEMYGSALAQVKRKYSEQFLKAEILKKGHKIESIQYIGERIEIIAGY
jgi:hypothetical protein